MKQENEIIDFFPHQTRSYTICNKHKQHTLKLVCLSEECPLKGLICVDCLIKDHQNSKCQIRKLEDFEIEVSQQQFQKNKNLSQQIIQLKQQQRQLIEVKNNVLKLLNYQEIQYQQQIEQLEEMKISQQQIKEFVRLIKQQKFQEIYQKLKEKENIKIEDDSDKINFENYLNQSIEFIEENKLVLEKLQKIQKRELITIASTGTLQCLEQYDSSITELRIRFDQKIENQEFLELKRFYQLNFLQLGLSRNDGTPEQLNKLIKRTGEINTLKYLHINFSNSNVNEQCLNNLFNIAGSLSLLVLSIMLDFAEINQEQLIQLLERNASKLNRVKEFRFYNNNQLWDLSDVKEVLNTLTIIQ